MTGVSEAAADGDAGERVIGRRAEYLGLVEATVDQVVDWTLVERGAEKSVERAGRFAGEFAERFNRDFFLEVSVHVGGLQSQKFLFVGTGGRRFNPAGEERERGGEERAAIRGGCDGRRPFLRSHLVHESYGSFDDSGIDVPEHVGAPFFVLAGEYPACQGIGDKQMRVFAYGSNEDQVVDDRILRGFGIAVSCARVDDQEIAGFKDGRLPFREVFERT